MDDSFDYQEPEKESIFRKEKPVKTTPKVMPLRSTKKSGVNTELCVICPTSVEDAREITETLLANQIVLLNMEGLELSTAQRIIDFTSGSCFAIAGNLQKVSNYIFVATPANVEISGDFLDMVDSIRGNAIKTDYL